MARQEEAKKWPFSKVTFIRLFVLYINARILDIGPYSADGLSLKVACSAGIAVLYSPGYGG